MVMSLGLRGLSLDGDVIGSEGGFPWSRPRSITRCNLDSHSGKGSRMIMTSAGLGRGFPSHLRPDLTYCGADIHYGWRSRTVVSVFSVSGCAGGAGGTR